MEIQAKGVRVHYELSGQGKNRAVLLHGWGCSAKLMESTAAFLSQDMQVLILDFPAHGESGRPPEPWGVPEYAACTLEVLKKLDFLPCSVIAHSFGGRVTIWLASEKPELFNKLVFTGAAGIKKPQTEEGKKRSAEYKRLKKLCDQADKLKIFGSLTDMARKALKEHYGSADYNALDEEMQKTFVRVVNLDLTDRLCRIQQPTLLMWGEKDDATPLWMGQKMEQLIPDSGLVVMKNGTHYAYLEQNAYFNQVVHHFLTEE